MLAAILTNSLACWFSWAGKAPKRAFKEILMHTIFTEFKVREKKVRFNHFRQFTMVIFRRPIYCYAVCRGQTAKRVNASIFICLVLLTSPVQQSTTVVYWEHNVGLLNIFSLICSDHSSVVGWRDQL